MSGNISGVPAKGSFESCTRRHRDKKELLNNHFVSYTPKCWLRAINGQHQFCLDISPFSFIYLMLEGCCFFLTDSPNSFHICESQHLFL